MPAPKGNKFAEKWTRKQALELANKALETVSNSCYFISEVADKCDTYREFFYYIMNKFNDDEEVFNTLKKMQNKCEYIIIQKTQDKTMPVALGIFILKSYHGLIETSNLNVGSSEDQQPLTLKIGDQEFNV